MSKIHAGDRLSGPLGSGTQPKRLCVLELVRCVCASQLKSLSRQHFLGELFKGIEKRLVRQAEINFLFSRLPPDRLTLEQNNHALSRDLRVMPAFAPSPQLRAGITQTGSASQQQILKDPPTSQARGRATKPLRNFLLTLQVDCSLWKALPSGAHQHPSNIPLRQPLIIE